MRELSVIIISANVRHFAIINLLTNEVLGMAILINILEEETLWFIQSL